MAPSEASELTLEMKQLISLNIGSDVKKLARELGFDEPEISNLVLEEKNPYEFCFQVLTRWGHKQGLFVPVNPIIRALQKIRRNDVIRLICQEDLEDTNLAYPVISEEEQALAPLKDVLGTLEKNMRERYDWDIQLPQQQWMDKILPLDQLYVDLEMFSTDKYGDEEKGKGIRLDQIFEMVNRIEPRRILIEGAPGFGKTTLALKILFDWTHELKYLKKFRLIFSFSLRYLNDYKSLEEALMESISMMGIERTLGFECIKKFQNEILLILDGFDELGEDSKSKLDSFLEKRAFPNMFIILTSRPGWFNSKDNKGKGSVNRLQMGISQSYFWNKRVFIKGISEESRDVFIQNYFKDNEEQIKKTFSVFQKTTHDLFQCPLFLILLASIIEDEVIEEINTRTRLYKYFFNSIFRRGLIREKLLPEDAHVDLFDLEQPTQPFYLQDFVNFGKLALKRLMKDDLSILESDLSECQGESGYFLKLGILSKNVIFQHRNRVEVYQPIHKTFLEFSAAFYLFSNSDSLKNKDFKAEIMYWVEKGCGFNSKSLIYPFLGGLMNDDAAILFDAVSPWVALNPNHGEWTLDVLREIDNKMKIFPCLLPFIPPILDLNMVLLNQNYSFVEAIVQQLHRESAAKSIQILKLDEETFYKVNDMCSIFVHKIILKVGKRVKPPSWLDDLKMKAMRCNHLICDCELEGIDEYEWSWLFSLISSIDTDNITFAFYCSALGSRSIIDFHKTLTQDTWKHITLYRLMVHDQSIEKNTIPLLTDLVRTGKIRSSFILKISSAVKEELEQLIDAVFDCDSLQEFVLCKDPTSPCRIRVNLDILNKSVTKKCLRFHGIDFVRKIGKRSKKLLVKEMALKFVDCEQTLDLLSCCTGIEYLECSSKVLETVFRRERSCLESVQELHLLSCESLHLAPALKNLQVLSLNVYVEKGLGLDVLAYFVRDSSLKVLEFLDIRNESILMPFLRLWLAILQKKRKLLQSSALEKTNRVTNMNGLVFEFCNTVHLPDERFKLCFPLIRELLVNKLVERFSAFTSVGSLNLIPSVFPLSEGFTTWREIRGMKALESCRSRQRHLFYITVLAYREGVSVTHDNIN